MAWLAADAAFNPDSLDNNVIGIQAELGNHDSGLHRHTMGQLLFTRRGCIKITLGEGTGLCLLPPTRAAWIPARTSHRAEMKQTVDYRSLWFAPTSFPALPREVEVISVNPLLRELLERIAGAPYDTDWRKGKAAHLVALCLAEMTDAAREPMLLPLPVDRRLSGLTAAADMPPPLHVLAARTGASAKTIGRLFRRDTGMSYQQWRQQWRLMRSVELLATGRRTTDVASELGFASDSAFIAFFKGMLGVTPKRYLRS